MSHAQFALPTTLTANGFFNSGIIGKEFAFGFHLGDALAVIASIP
jgi:hypothetical protein